MLTADAGISTTTSFWHRRALLEKAIERAINLLDRIDGDPDAEGELAYFAGLEIVLDPDLESTDRMRGGAA